jgi:flagellar biosynthesis protein FlhG
LLFSLSLLLLFFGVDLRKNELQLEKNTDTYDNAGKRMSKIFKRGSPHVPAELKRTVDRLLHRGGSPEVQALRDKSIALTSGKGGVGKTITAANLSLYCAQKGYSTALIDLDPLSDLATLLDLAEAEASLEEQAVDLDKATLQSVSTRVFDHLDLIFPTPKLKKAERSNLLQKIYRDLCGELNGSYDLLVFDLPAGSEFEDNLVFLPFMKMVLLVTNPEPTSHAAAGAYVKRAFEVYQELNLNVWHNRFSPNTQAHCNPKDIVGNYNRNVPEELRIDERAARRLRDFASVPEDPALNLLRGSPAADENVLRFLLDTLAFIHDERVAALAAATISSRSFELVRHFISHHKTIENTDEYLEEIGRYLRVLLEVRLLADQRPAPDAAPAEFFTPEEKEGFRAFLQKLDSDSLRRRIIRTMDLLETKLRQLEDKKSPFASGAAVVPDKSVDRELSALLVAIDRIGSRNKLMVNQGALLLFYFSLYKLFQSKTVTELIRSLVPAKRNSQGALVRDRHRQIKNLVEGNPEYKLRYLKLLKTLHPIVSKQIGNIVKAFGLSGLLFRDETGTIVRSAYVKLLTNFLHDTLYSGLSIVVGFPFRSAASAFQEGAERILQTLGENRPS